METTTTATASKLLMAARFSTTCPVCQKLIQVGEPIVYLVDTHHALHEDCNRSVPRLDVAEILRMDAREMKGRQIAQTATIRRNGDLYIVPSRSGNGTYKVDLSLDPPGCNCADREQRELKCLHAHAVEWALILESAPAGSTVAITRVARPTYKQDWPNYDRSQTEERRHFAQMLQGLCEGIMQPRAGRGRPRHHLADVIFSLVWRAYSGKSLRRMMGELCDFADRGYTETAVHWNTLADYDRRSDITPVLRVLVEESAAPLRNVEENFAIDSSGFSTSQFGRWYDHKWGRERTMREWVKCHISVGVKTHVVAGVTVTRGAGDDTSDASQFGALVEQTAATIGEVDQISADKAYLGRDALETVVSVGAVPYIPFKSNSAPGKGQTLWRKLFHYYNFRRDEFLEHYHRRSNVETAFSMIKRKFGASVRSKGAVGQENEILCRVIAHNLCCLVASIYEFGIKPEFFSTEAR